MRILTFKRTLPWPTWSGQDLRTFNVLKHLSRRHAVRLACWEGQASDLRHMPFEAELVALPENDGIRGRDLTERILVDHYGLFASSIPWLAAQIDAYRPDMLLGVDYQTLTALDAHRDHPRACYLGDNRWLQDLERLRREKMHVWGHLKSVLWSFILHGRYASAADAYIFVADRDAQALRRFTRSRCLGVANGVDTDFFQPCDSPAASHSVVFTGSLNFPPNIDAVCWFCRRVWPLVRESTPDARLTLVGKRPLERVLAFDGQDGIRVVGDVPDIRPYMEEAAVAVVPMQSGGGIKNKILEGWAMGLPIVATSMSLHSLAARNGDNILVADEPRGFSQRVIELLADDRLRAGLGRRARETAVSEHSWEQTARQIESCLVEIARSHTGVQTCH